VPINPTVYRLQSELHRFLYVKNNFADFDAGILPLVGQMRRKKLVASTIHNYVLKMATGQVRTPKIRRVIKALSKAAVRQKSRRAKRLTLRQALAMLQPFGGLPRGAKHERAALELILRTGLRTVDIACLHRRDIVFTNIGITVTYTEGKGVGSGIDRRTFRLPYEKFFGPASQHLQNLFANHERPFATLEVGDINNMLKRYARRIQQSGRHHTSYSWRRIFIRRAIFVCNHDCKKAARKYTMHRDWRMVQAYYDDNGSAI
jgi:integrase